MRILLLLVLCCAPLFAQRTKRVKPYFKKNGTAVQSHIKTKPNKTRVDNYSTKGNTNPYTGKKGSKPIVKPPQKRGSNGSR